MASYLMQIKAKKGVAEREEKRHLGLILLRGELNALLHVFMRVQLVVCLDVSAFIPELIVVTPRPQEKMLSLFL